MLFLHRRSKLGNGGVLSDFTKFHIFSTNDMPIEMVQECLQSLAMFCKNEILLNVQFQGINLTNLQI